MSCNLPCVATDVGDIKWLFGNVEGYFLTNHTVGDVAEKISKAIEYSKNVGITKGRERIIELGLDSFAVADKLVSLYSKTLN